MKTSTKQFRPTISKIMMALALASIIGGISITPALAKDNDGHHDRGWHKGEQRGDLNEWNRRHERNDYRYR